MITTLDYVRLQPTKRKLNSKTGKNMSVQWWTPPNETPEILPRRKKDMSKRWDDDIKNSRKFWTNERKVKAEVVEVG